MGKSKNANRFFLLLIGLLFSIHVLAAGKVSEFSSPTEIWVELTLDTTFKEDQKVIIVSEKEKNKLVAFGKVRSLEVREERFFAKIEILEIVSNHMVMIGDIVEPMDFKIFEERKIPGFNSLTLGGSHKIPAQYKELAYFGVFTSEGHNIDRDEFLISPFQIQYGLTNDVNLRMVNTLLLDGYLNLGGKYKVFHNKHVKITLNSLGAYKVLKQDWIAQVGGVISTPSSEKFQNHLMFKFTFDPQYEDSKATRDLGLFTDSDIRSITEYITDRWNRVLYGPVYNVELQTFGGTVSYMWIWNTFHMSLGLATRDFSNLNFDRIDGYYYIYDFFWRF